MSTEIPLMTEFLIQYHHTAVRLFRRNVFKRLTVNNDKVSMLKAGIKGQCDVYGYISSRGTVFGSGNKIVGHTTKQGYAIPIEIEFKGVDTIVTPAQKNWRQFCLQIGIPHIVLRAGIEENDMMVMLRWNNELNKFIHDLVS